MDTTMQPGMHAGAEAPAGVIVFFRFGRWSHINDSLEQLLRREFPRQRLVIIDLWGALRRRRLVLAAMVGYGLALYRPPLHLGKGEFSFFHLSPPAQRYVIEMASALARQAVGDSRVVFTIQTTTRFRVDFGEAPHFVYTDTLESLKPIDPRRGRRTRLETDVLAHEQRILDGCEAFMTMFRAVADAAVRDYGKPRDAVRTIYAGPNATMVSTGPVNRPAGRKVILFIAVQWRRKGGDLLVEAFREVRRRHPDAELWIVGVTPRGVREPGVKFFGLQDKEALGRFYREAAVFCLPSRRDFFPISLLEAMSTGLPVVASRTGGVPEMIEDGKSGLVLPVGDVPALAKALVALLDDPGRREAMGRAAQQRVAELFNWQSVGQRMAETIRATPRVREALAEPQRLDSAAA